MQQLFLSLRRFKATLHMVHPVYRMKYQKTQLASSWSWMEMNATMNLSAGLTHTLKLKFRDYRRLLRPRCNRQRRNRSIPPKNIKDIKKFREAIDVVSVGLHSIVTVILGQLQLQIVDFRFGR